MDSFKKDKEGSLWSELSVNDKVNTVLSFLRALIFLFCAILTSMAFGMDSNTCVFFIVVATTLADIAMSTSSVLAQGQPRTILRGFVFAMTLICLFISEKYAEAVSDQFATAALLVCTIAQFYIFRLSYYDDKDIDEKSEAASLNAAGISCVIFVLSLIFDQSEFPQDVESAITYARHKIANVIFIAISADEYMDGQLQKRFFSSETIKRRRLGHILAVFHNFSVGLFL